MADRFALFVRDDKRCHEVTPTVRLILYALASRADAKGYCWPSVEVLQQDTGLSRASIFRALKDVRGVLTVDAPGYKHSNSYIFPYQKMPQRPEGPRGKTDVDKSQGAVDNQSHSETGVSQRDCDSLTVRLGGSHSETGGGLTVRPEEDNRRIQEVSLSLTPSNPKKQSHSETCVDNSYDGTTKPKTRKDLDKIIKWCELKGLDQDHITEFMRINRLARWNQVSVTCTVADLISDFAFKWKSDNPGEYYSYQTKIASRDKARR